jgi:hypothetical protein
VREHSLLISFKVHCSQTNEQFWTLGYKSGLGNKVPFLRLELGSTDV